MYALVFAEVEGGKRDAEAVLMMLQTHLTTTVEYRLYRTFCGRTYQLVVNLQVAEYQWNLSDGVDVGRVEHGNALRTAKYQTAVG